MKRLFIKSSLQKKGGAFFLPEQQSQDKSSSSVVAEFIEFNGSGANPIPKDGSDSFFGLGMEEVVTSDAAATVCLRWRLNTCWGE